MDVHIDCDQGNKIPTTLATGLDKTNDSITTYEKGCSMAVIDLAPDAATTVSAVPAILLGVHVDVVMSAHAVTISDGATPMITLAASTAAGTNLNFYGATFATSIVVTPNASSTGTITVFYRAI